MKSYLLQINSEKPRIKQSFVTKCYKGREMWQKLPVTNPTNEQLVVEVISSKPDLIVPIKRKLTLGPKETQNAVLYFQSYPHRAKKEVFIFVNEAVKEKSKFNHSYMIEVNYEQP